MPVISRTRLFDAMVNQQFPAWIMKNLNKYSIESLVSKNFKRLYRIYDMKVVQNLI